MVWRFDGLRFVGYDETTQSETYVPRKRRGIYQIVLRCSPINSSAILKGMKDAHPTICNFLKGDWSNRCMEPVWGRNEKIVLGGQWESTRNCLQAWIIWKLRLSHSLDKHLSRAFVNIFYVLHRCHNVHFRFYHCAGFDLITDIAHPPPHFESQIQDFAEQEQYAEPTLYVSTTLYHSYSCHDIKYALR